MLGILDGDLTDIEKSRISDLGLDPNNADDLSLLRTRLSKTQNILGTSEYIEFTLQNMINNSVASKFYSQTSEAGKAAIEKEMNLVFFGDSSIGKKSVNAFIHAIDASAGNFRTYIVSRNFFRTGGGQRSRANTLIHEASHFLGTVDKGGSGFNNARKFADWVTLRPDP